MHDTPSKLYLDTQEYTYNEKQTSGDACVMVQVHTLEEKDGHIRSLQQANKALQQDKDGLQRNLQQVQQFKDGLQRNLQQAQQAKDILQQDLHQTKEDLKKAKEEVRSLTALCNILKVYIANPNLMF